MIYCFFPTYVFFVSLTSGGMHSRTAIRFYEINTPLTEAVLPDGRNYKTTLSLCYQLL
jgi:hypothetical protein